MITFERFEAAKMARFVSRYGKSFTFKRSVLNAYKQPTSTLASVCAVKGVYHEASYSHLAATESGGGEYVKEITPMIMCLSDEYSKLIAVDDVVEVNGKTMIVTKIKDINNSSFALDISLRWEDNGGTA